MKLSPQKLFLIDGLGALLTAILTGLVLTTFEQYFGIPKMVLYYLAAVAGLFAIYSLWNTISMQQNWPTLMTIIALANLTYCSATLALVIYHRQKVTYLGMAYIALETIVVVVLAMVELKMARQKQ